MAILPGATAAAGAASQAGASSPPPVTSLPAPHPDQVDALAAGRALTALFFDTRLEDLHGRFETRLGQVLKLSDLARLRTDVQGQFGTQLDVLDERVTTRDSLQVYTRLARFGNAGGPIEISWAFDAAGSVAGFHVRPPQAPAPTDYLDYRTRTPLRLPFDGAWHVFWGGRTLRENHHAVAPDQRFAYDFMLREGPLPCQGDCQTNEQHYAFGKPALAPAAGTVVAAVDGVADNAIGQMNHEQPLGNHVILDHGNGEYSFLAHLQQGSVAVRPGQKAQSGAHLGRCGNSGYSSLPHLHYHLQTTAAPFTGKGLPAQFLDYRLGEEKVARGEPKQGQTVSTP
jgi:murein DD-endopeptidase MepM/ murein hydrolase activator NlpD